MGSGKNSNVSFHSFCFICQFLNYCPYHWFFLGRFCHLQSALAVAFQKKTPRQWERKWWALCLLPRWSQCHRGQQGPSFLGKELDTKGILSWMCIYRNLHWEIPEGSSWNWLYVLLYLKYLRICPQWLTWAMTVELKHYQQNSYKNLKDCSGFLIHMEASWSQTGLLFYQYLSCKVNSHTFTEGVVPKNFFIWSSLGGIFAPVF